MMDLKQYVTIVEDWPKKGIRFKDISTIMDNGKAYKYATDQIVKYAKTIDTQLFLRTNHLVLLSKSNSCFNFSTSSAIASKLD